jgi:hypothetical protein
MPLAAQTARASLIESISPLGVMLGVAEGEGSGVVVGDVHAITTNINESAINDRISR